MSSIKTKEDAWAVLQKWQDFSFDAVDNSVQEIHISQEGSEEVISALEADIYAWDAIQLSQPVAHEIKSKLRLKGIITYWLAAALITTFSSSHKEQARAEFIKLCEHVPGKQTIRDGIKLIELIIKRFGRESIRTHGQQIKLTESLIFSSREVSGELNDTLWVEVLTMVPGPFSSFGKSVAKVPAFKPSDSLTPKLRNIIANSKVLERWCNDAANASKYREDLDFKASQDGLEKLIACLGDVAGYECFEGQERFLVKAGCHSLFKQIIYQRELGSISESQSTQANILKSIFGI